jgi:hypothetical protein
MLFSSVQFPRLKYGGVSKSVLNRYRPDDVNDEDGENEDEDDDNPDKLFRKRFTKPNREWKDDSAKSQERKFLEEQFEEVLKEYDDDQIGELNEGEDIQGKKKRPRRRRRQRH